MGNEITGSNTMIGLKLGSTFGTAETVGTGDKLEVESLTHSENTEELTSNSIGSGQNMAVASNRGSTSPTVSFEHLMHYDDAGIAALKQFMGSEATPMLMSAGSGWTHSLLYNETHNAKWATIAFQAINSSTGLFEYPSCAATRLELRAENPPDYVRQNMEFLGNDQLISGQTNDQTALNATTITDSTKIIVAADDEFLINAASGGALASPTDRVNIESAVLTLTKPQAHVREIKGSSGNGEPISSGGMPLEGELTVVFRALSDLTWFTAHKNETEYKASLLITGPALTVDLSFTRYFRWYLPRLIVIQPPQYDLSDPGNNKLTVVFKCLAAAAAPTGMLDTYPYFIIQNARSTVY